jgi:hypothetical protein
VARLGRRQVARRAFLISAAPGPTWPGREIGGDPSTVRALASRA